MGLFGKQKAQIDVGGFLPGFLAGMGAPGGVQHLNAYHQRRQGAADAELAEQQYQRRLADQQKTWLEREMWERANPAPRAPTEFERMLEASGLKPGTAEYQKVIRQYVNNRANPFIPMTVQNPDGSETRQFIRPPMGADLPETLTDDDWGTPQTNGGQSVPPTGGFPNIGRYRRY